MKVTRQAPPGHGFDLVLEFSGLLEEPRNGVKPNARVIRTRHLSS
jgi:hypothetical protein